MSRPRKEEGLSAEALKKKMYHSLQSAGVVNQLKGYLRQSVVNELRGKSKESQFLEKSDLLAATIRQRDTDWSQRAVDNLVLHHLKQSRYLYSLSLFQQEAGVNEYDESLTNELLHQLGASSELLRHHGNEDKENDDLSMNLVGPHTSSTPVSRGHRDTDESKFLLWRIMSGVASARHLATKVDPEAFMRDSVKQPRTLTLADKLQAIDEEMDATLRDRRYDDIEHRKSIATLASATRRAEEAAEKRAREALEQWKKVELASLKVKEAEKTKQQVSERTKQLEEDYSRRKEALMQREQNAIDRLNNQKELLEKDLHQQRQILLRELEQIRIREKTLLEKEQMMRDVEAVKLRELELMKTEFLSRHGNIAEQSHTSMDKSRRDSVVSSCAESLRKSLTGKEGRQLDEVLNELHLRSGEADMLRKELMSMKEELAQTKNQMERLSKHQPQTAGTTSIPTISPRTEESQSLRRRLDDLTRQLNEWKQQDRANREAAIHSEIGRWKEEVTKLSEARDQLDEKQRHLEDMTLRLQTKMNSATDKPRSTPLPYSSLRLLMDPQRGDPARERSIREYDPVPTGHVRWADKMPYSVQPSMLDKSVLNTSHNSSNNKLDDSGGTTTSSSSHELTTSGLRFDIQEKFRALEKESDELEQMYKRYVQTNYRHISSDIPRMSSDIPYHRSPLSSPRYSARASTSTKSPRHLGKARTRTQYPAYQKHPSEEQTGLSTRPTHVRTTKRDEAPVLPEYRLKQKPESNFSKDVKESDGDGMSSPDNESLKENMGKADPRTRAGEMKKADTWSVMNPSLEKSPGPLQIENLNEGGPGSDDRKILSHHSPVPSVPSEEAQTSSAKAEKLTDIDPPAAKMHSTLPPLLTRAGAILPPISSKSSEKLSSSVSDLLLGPIRHSPPGKNKTEDPRPIPAARSTTRDSLDDLLMTGSKKDDMEEVSDESSSTAGDDLPLKMSSLDSKQEDPKAKDKQTSFDRPALLVQKREELSKSLDQSESLLSPKHDTKDQSDNLLSPTLHLSLHDDSGLQNILDSIDINSARSIDGDTNEDLANLLNQLEPNPTVMSQREHDKVAESSQRKDTNSPSVKEEATKKKENVISNLSGSDQDENLLSDLSVNEYSDKFLSSSSSKTSSVSEVKTMSDFEPSSTSIPRIEDKIPDQQHSGAEEEKSGAEVHWSNLQFDKSGEVIPSDTAREETEKKKKDEDPGQEEEDAFDQSLSTHSLEAPSGKRSQSSEEDFW